MPQRLSQPVTQRKAVNQRVLYAALKPCRVVRTAHTLFMLLFVLFALPAVFISQTAFGSTIYRIVDENGRVTYTDKAAAITENVEQTTLAVQTYRQLHHVKSVYDGDTIILENGQRVRFLGINTPEIASRHRDAEPGGMAAKTWLRERIGDQPVYLEHDQEKRDKYKRLLAHVFLSDGTHLNLALVEQGLAFMSIVPPNLRYVDAMSRAQQGAEAQRLGIWNEPDYPLRELHQISAELRGWQRVNGKPRAIESGRSFTYLVLNDRVSIRIANDHLNLFPKLDTYLGKTLEVRGWLSRRKDSFSISVQHPSALIAR